MQTLFMVTVEGFKKNIRLVELESAIIIESNYPQLRTGISSKGHKRASSFATLLFLPFKMLEQVARHRAMLGFW